MIYIVKCLEMLTLKVFTTIYIPDNSQRKRQKVPDSKNEANHA